MFYNCACFYSRNIFLRKYGLHITYKDECSFKTLYGETLRQKGCKSNEQFEAIFKEIKDEIQRRRDICKSALYRRELIASRYRPLHPSIYLLKESFLDPKFLHLVYLCKNAGMNEDVKKSITVHKSFRLYAFPIFTQEFCDMLIEELEHFERSDLPKGRPNTMSNNGCLLEELGFDKEFLEPLRMNYISWITRFLFPDFGGGSLDSHRVFTVKYSMGQDRNLGAHYDNAEITLNVCLGKDFSAGGLNFRGLNTEMYETSTYHYPNSPRYGILHRGRQMHEALPIESGTRHNMVMWMRSSSVRNHLCPMCLSVPQLEKDTTGGYGQGFTMREERQDNPRFVDVCVV
ncbi:2-oxoglutarate and iron-dependent oxygenase domain-containing protein 2-like [Octopus vulgaris]|uniref:2-oxoglutarate and iron-dependent oxygenase domain-containing protein 2-like n=1 Tax=Octopus vulgaris TaxID=6645 RepID=A0AA36AY66_OCTVU|nr:2-oxoglutarate and iron-dependent oxygenase domain-containing protein 2-like [Octopus vulgaris]